MIVRVKAITIEMQHLLAACTKLYDCLMSLQLMPSAYPKMFFGLTF